MLRRQSAIQIKTNIESPLEKQPVRRSENIPPNAPLSLKGQSKMIKSTKSSKTIDTQLFSLQPIENPSGMPDIFYRRKPKSDQLTPPLVPTQISFALVEQKQILNQPQEEDLNYLLLENEELRNKIQTIANNEEQMKKNFADELETLTQAINSERQHFQQIEKEMKDEENRLKAHINQLEQKQSKHLQQQIEAKEKELQLSQKQLKQTKDSLENEISGLNKKNEDLLAKIKTLEQINIQQVNEIKNIWDELNKTVKDWEKDQNQSQNQITQRDQQISSLQKRIQEMDQMLGEQEKQIQLQDNRYNIIESLLQSKQNADTEDNEEIFSTQLNQMKNEKEELVQQLKDQESLLKSFKSQIIQQEQALINQQKEYEESIKNLIQESENWKARFLTLESEVHQNNQEQIFQHKRTFSLQFEKKELVQEIYDLKQCNENLQNEIGEIQAYYQEECNALAQQISQLQNIIQFKDRQYTELKEQLQVQENNSHRSFTVDITSNMLLDIHRQEEAVFKPLDFQNIELNKLREIISSKDSEIQELISKLQSTQDELTNQLNDSQNKNQFLFSQLECQKQSLESIKFLNENLQKEVVKLNNEKDKLQLELVSKHELGQQKLIEAQSEIKSEFTKVIKSLNYEIEMQIQQNKNLSQQQLLLKEESQQEIQQLRQTNLSYKNQLNILNDFLGDNETIIKKLQSQIQSFQDENQNSKNMSQSLREQFEKEKQFYVEQLANLSSEKKKIEEQLLSQLEIKIQNEKQIISEQYEHLLQEKDEAFQKQQLEYKTYKMQTENTIKELILEQQENDKSTQRLQMCLNEKDQIITKSQSKIEQLEFKLSQQELNHLKQIETLTHEIEKQNQTKITILTEWENQVKNRLEHEVRELVTQFVNEKDQLKREIGQLQYLLSQKQENFEHSRISSISDRLFDQQNSRKYEASLNLTQR